MKPIILFNYFYPSELDMVCRVYKDHLPKGDDPSSNDPIIFSFIDKDMDDLDNFECVVLPRILADDIERLKHTSTEDSYFNYDDFISMRNKMKNKFGDKLLESIISTDIEAMINNITSSINFLMNDVFKTNTVVISYRDMDNVLGISSTYPTLIYSALQQNFIIKEHKQYFGIPVITITKKGECDNVDDAN